jgi:hypothetical protein
MQTSMDKNPAIALKGVPANFDLVKTEALLNEDTTAIEPGYPLVRGTDPGSQVLLPVADFTPNQFAGIAVFGSAKEIPLASATTGTEYATNDRVPVAVEGVVYVLVEDTVTKGEPVFAVHTAGASSVWTFRGDADTAAASDIPAIFQENGVTGDVVPIRFTWSV